MRLQNLVKFHDSNPCRLTDLIPDGAQTMDLFDRRDTARQSKLMAAMDHINQAMGRRTLFYANSGTQQKWSGASARRSPAYTTDWDSLIQVKATWSYPKERE